MWNFSAQVVSLRVPSTARSVRCSVIWWLCRSGDCWRRLDGWTASCGSDREVNDSTVVSVCSIIQLIYCIRKTLSSFSSGRMRKNVTFLSIAIEFPLDWIKTKSQIVFKLLMRVHQKWKGQFFQMPEPGASTTLPPAGTRGEAQTCAVEEWSWRRLPCEGVSVLGRVETHQSTSSAASLPAGTLAPDSGAPVCKDNMQNTRTNEKTNTLTRVTPTKNRLITKCLFQQVLLLLTWKLQDQSSDWFFHCRQRQ